VARSRKKPLRRAWQAANVAAVLSGAAAGVEMVVHVIQRLFAGFHIRDRR
jgi:hypothetical protein